MRRAEDFFTGRGEFAVAIGRALPVIRAFTSLVAGFVEVPVLQFGALSLLGTVVYVTAITLIGYAAGSAWHSIARYIAIGGYAIVAILVITVVAFIIYRLRELRKEAAARSARAAAATAAEDQRRTPSA